MVPKDPRKARTFSRCFSGRRRCEAGDLALTFPAPTLRFTQRVLLERRIMRTILVSLTLVSMVLHAVFGCHWHIPAHAQETDRAAPQQSAKPKPSCCHHHHEEENQPADESQQKHEQIPQKCPGDHGSRNCPDESCQWVSPSPSESVSLSKLLLPEGVSFLTQRTWSVVGPEQVTADNPFPIPLIFGCPASVRLHLWKQIWLL